MRRLRIGGLLAVVVGVVALTAASAQAASGNVTCTTEIDSATITGNVTVPAGATCALYGDTVEGNVSAGDGAQLILGSFTIIQGSVSVAEGAAFGAFLATIQRNLSTEGALEVIVIESAVEGNTSFDATSGNLDICGAGTSQCVFFTINPGSTNPGGKDNKFGNVSITNTTAPGGALYVGNFVAGNLTCYGNTSVSNGGEANTVLGHESGQCAGLDPAP